MIPILQVGTPKSRKGEWLALGTAVGAQSQDAPQVRLTTEPMPYTASPCGWLQPSWGSWRGGVGCREGKEQAGFSGWNWGNELSLLGRVDLLLPTTFPNPAQHRLG